MARQRGSSEAAADLAANRPPARAGRPASPPHPPGAITRVPLALCRQSACDPWRPAATPWRRAPVVNAAALHHAQLREHRIGRKRCRPRAGSVIRPLRVHDGHVIEAAGGRRHSSSRSEPGLERLGQRGAHVQHHDDQVAHADVVQAARDGATAPRQLWLPERRLRRFDTACRIELPPPPAAGTAICGGAMQQLPVIPGRRGGVQSPASPARTAGAAAQCQQRFEHSRARLPPPPPASQHPVLMHGRF